jgi:hypothetical protein
MMWIKIDEFEDPTESIQITTWASQTFIGCIVRTVTKSCGEMSESMVFVPSGVITRRDDGTYSLNDR